MTQKELTKRNECWYCIHKQSVPGNAHIKCNNPDQEMIGDPYGIRKGWYCYPLLFDPVWKLKKCSNFERKTDGTIKNPKTTFVERQD